MDLLVGDLMETAVVDIAASASVKTAAQVLLDHDIGSLIVSSEDDVPVGIVSDTDVLRAVVTTDGNLSDVPVEKCMSRPLLMIEKSKPIRSAVRRMNQEGVEQLVIADEYEVEGIVSRKDITESYEALIHAAHESEKPPSTY